MPRRQPENFKSGAKYRFCGAEWLSEEHIFAPMPLRGRHALET
jgi:hypothetical protein